MNIGLVINPWAGIGGTVALKGSDGADIRQKALLLGARPRANEKTEVMLTAFFDSCLSIPAIHWYVAPGAMGAQALSSFDLDPEQITIQPTPIPVQTEAIDTQATVAWFIEQNVDIIVFAGGDGTARNVCQVVNSLIPVIGIPAGVKIHSGVFAVTAHAAGEVLAGLIDGRLTELRSEEVRDINEDAFRENRVVTKYYGEMKVPVSGEFMQHVKVGGIESEPLVLSEIADWLVDNMLADVCYFVGSGKTTATLMEHLRMPNTLLGIDACLNGRVIQQDCTESDLLNLLESHPCVLILSIIGGQGHIFGRGNAQLSPTVLRKMNKSQLWLVGSKAKIKSLEGRPLLIDSSVPELDQKWAGFLTVITGYNDHLIYPAVAL